MSSINITYPPSVSVVAPTIRSAAGSGPSQRPDLLFPSAFGHPRVLAMTRNVVNGFSKIRAKKRTTNSQKHFRFQALAIEYPTPSNLNCHIPAPGQPFDGLWLREAKSRCNLSVACSHDQCHRPLSSEPLSRQHRFGNPTSPALTQQSRLFTSPDRGPCARLRRRFRLHEVAQTPEPPCPTSSQQAASALIFLKSFLDGLCKRLFPVLVLASLADLKL